ncbi:MAG: hypothetical protein AAF962_02970 [Actinomycetota bacterium]
MRRSPTRSLGVALVGLALVGAACSSGDETDDEAAPAIVIEGSDTESAAAEGGADGADSTDGSGESAGSAAAPDDEELALDFAQCMRDNGVPEFEDPTVDAEGGITFGGGPGGGPDAIDPEDPAVIDAFDICAERLEGASFLPGADTDISEIEDNLLAVAECLRDEGIDVDDPDLGGGIGPGSGVTGPADIFGEGFDPDDPTTAAAIEVCQSVFAPGAGGGN